MSRDKERESIRKKRLRSNQRQQVIKAYGRKCANCKDADDSVLTVDHVNNDGAAHRVTRQTGGSWIYAWAIRNKFPPNLQLLCWNCNCFKQFRGKGKVPEHRRDMFINGELKPKWKRLQ